MELKVWVDGIQRVVCGAGYETTCRDVVLALAHSMSRTGRFTLVEKWRESERPLTPSECPLLSLHKWGEYASEVKFYLIQAESEKPLGGRGDGKLDELISKMPKLNGCTNPTGYDSLKRSLTFSGGNTVGVVPHSSRNAGDASSSYHAKLGRGDMTTSSSASLSSSGGCPDLGLLQFRNGKLAKNSSNSHTFQAPVKQIDKFYSPKSSTKGDSLVAGAKVQDVREQRPAGIVGTNRGDVRELHPANIPGSASMYGQGQHMSHHNSSYPNPTQQAGHSGHTVPSLPSQRPSHFQPSQRTATLSTASQNLHPANAPSPVPIPASRQGHQQLASQQLPASADHFPPSQAQSQQGNPSHPLQSASSQPSSSHSSRPLIKQRPLPAPRHSQTTPTLVDNSNAPPQVKTVQAPQPRQRSRERIGTKEAQTSGLQNSKSDQIKFLNFHNNKHPIIDDSFYSNDDSDNKFPKPSNIRYAQNRRYRDSNTEVAEITGHINANNNSNSQGHLKTVENVRYPPNPPLSTFKSSTLERSVPRQNKAVPAPARSLSTEENKPDIVLPATGAAQPQYGGSRLNFVDSAAMKKLRPHAEAAGKAGPVSTFTSAVAHLRQRSADGILQLKPETHVRQLSSDSSHNTAAASQPGFESNKIMVPTTDHPKTIHSGNHSSVHDNQTKQLLSPNYLSSPSSSSPPHSTSPVTTPRFSSAFKEVSPRSSSQGFQLPVRALIPYSMDQPSFSTFGIGAPPYRPPIDGQHSRQPSVEVEEYDLDQNFPDVSHRDPVTGSSVSKNWNIPVEYSLDSGSITPVKSETEYLQLVRLIKMQQERLQMQEARISDTEMEISTLETQESQNQANQDFFNEELSKLEKMEKDGQQELMKLEKVHWENVMNGEKKIETSLQSQMSKLQEQIEELESKLQKLRSEEEGIHKEIEFEKEEVELRNKISQESERTAFTELSQLKEHLSHINKSIQMNENRLKDCEESVLKIEEDILDKEKKIESLTKEMMHNESGDIQSPVMMSKSSSLPKAYQNTVSQSVKAVHLSASDNGEAVLKILEGRLSPHPGSDGISGEGFKSPQSKLNSPVTTKNPDGVWV